MIAGMSNHKKINPVVTELFIRGRILLFCYAIVFSCSKNMRLNYTHYFIIKIPKKQRLQQIAINHSSDIVFRNFMNLYKKCTAKPYSY